MKKIARILVGFDFSPCSTRALQHAIDLAAAVGAELDILFVEVLHGETLNAATRQKLGRLVDEQLRSRDSVGLTVRKEVERYFAAAPALLDYAERRDVDLIIIGTHGRRGLRAMMLGSVSQEVVRNAPVPVLTIRGEGDVHGETLPVRRILVPFDFSPNSRKSLAVAVDVADWLGAEVVVLHVIEDRFHPAFYGMFFQSIHDLDPDIDGKAVEHLTNEVAAVSNPGVDIRVAVGRGHPSAEISAYADQHGVDLIVMSTHGLTGLARLSLGSVAERTLTSAHCPILTLRRVPQAEATAAGVVDLTEMEEVH